MGGSGSNKVIGQLHLIDYWLNKWNSSPYRRLFDGGEIFVARRILFEDCDIHRIVHIFLKISDITMIHFCKRQCYSMVSNALEISVSSLNFYNLLEVDLSFVSFHRHLLDLPISTTFNIWFNYNGLFSRTEWQNVPLRKVSESAILHSSCQLKSEDRREERLESQGVVWKRKKKKKKENENTEVGRRHSQIGGRST